uniref:Uncharacterized protein n=1 Tax=candidate division WOR-3 bacterium TaxID=2052148 RepID=A0A7V0Z4H3_UNCW3
MLEGYTQPLITSFGTGISTGIFHSARSHSLLGFDIGVRGMLIQIPEMGKYFDAKVLTCSLANDNLDYDSLELDSVSTIFGPKERTIVPVKGIKLVFLLISLVVSIFRLCRLQYLN